MTVQMSPPELSHLVRNDPGRRAEVKMYDALRDQLPGDWLVFYSVSWLGVVRPNEGPRDGEVDFIIAHPRKGILYLEVKGGRIRYDGLYQQWYTQNLLGQEFAIDPFRQAVKNKYAWLTKLKQVARLARFGLLPRAIHAVAFPDMLHPPRDCAPDAPAAIIIGVEDLPRLTARVEEILRTQADGPWPDYGPQIVAELKTLITRSITLPNPLALVAREEDRELVRLTEEQIDILDILGYLRRAAIVGPAGTGKTFLAVEKAKRLAGEGLSTLLTCFNRPLGEYLAAVTAGVPNLTAVNYHQLCCNLAVEAGLMVNGQYPPYDEQPNYLPDALVALPNRRFDAVVVDEGQDLKTDWWASLSLLMQEPNENPYYVFYDSHQALYRGRGDLPEELQDHVFQLHKNLRNTRHICRVMEPHYRGEVALNSLGPPGRPVEQMIYDRPADLPKLLTRTLQRLCTREGFSPHDLVLLTPRKWAKSALSTMEIPGYTLVEGSAQGPREIRCSSIYRFKGLEALVAIVVELDEQFTGQVERREQLCYVAFSRARTHLIVMGTSGVLPGLLPAVEQGGLA